MSEPARVAAPAAPPDVPFPGIEPYSYADRAVFFGRDSEARELIRLVVMYRGALLFSESGCGKSSLLNAGLIPLALGEGYRPEKIRVQPRKGQEIVIERITEKTDSGFRTFPSIFCSDENPERQILSAQQFLEVVRKKAAAARPILIFDQFEEWVTLFEERATGPSASDVREAHDAIREAIVNLLRDTRLPVKVLISLREDYLAKLIPLFRQYPSLPDQYLRLTSPGTTQVAALVRQPFERYPTAYSREISKLLAQEIEREFAEKSSSGQVLLTELQIVCQSLFETNLGTDDLLDYFSRQHVQGLLEQYLERALHSLKDEFREPAVCLLGKMVTYAGTRNVIQEDDLLSRVENEDSISRDLLKQTLNSLEKDTKLVRREPRRDVYYYEIASEFLVSWIRRKSLEHQRQAEQRKIEAERRKQEVELEAKRQASRRRVLLAVLTCAVLVAGALATTAWRVARRKAVEARQANARRLALFAHDKAEIDPELSILLALQATQETYQTDHSVVMEAETALREASQQARLQSLLQGHIGAVNDLGFSPDNTRLASASDDGTVKIWDVAQAKPIRTLSGHTDAVRKLDFDPQGKYLATASLDHTIRVWDASSGAPLMTVTDTDEILDVMFSPDGTRLVALMGDSKFKAWAVPSGQILPSSSQELEREFSDSIDGDVKFLGSRGTGEKLVLWDRITHKPIYTLKGREPSLSAFALSPDRKQAAASERDGSLKLWNVKSGQELLALPGLQEMITKLVFAGNTLATAGQDGTVNVWDLSSRSRLYKLSGHQSGIGAIRFSPDGSRLATAGKEDHIVKLWDASFRKDAHVLWESGTAIANPAISPKGDLLSGMAGNAINVWDLSAGRLILSLPTKASKSSLLSFSPDAKSLACAARDGSLSMFATSNGALLFKINAHSGVISAVSFSHDGARISTAGMDATVKVWDARSGASISTNAATFTPGSHLVLSPDGHRLAVANRGGSVTVLDVASGRTLYTLPLKEATLTSVAFSSSGQLATSGQRSGLSTWDAATGTQLRSFSAAPINLTRVTFSNGDKLLIGFVPPDQIEIWDVSSGALVHVIPKPPDLPVFAVVNPAQNRVISLSYTRSVVPTRDQPQRTRAIYRYVITEYPLAVEQLINLAKARVTRSLSKQECRDYYLSGPQCIAAAHVDEGTKRAQAGDVSGAETEFKQAKDLDPLLHLDPATEAARMGAEHFIASAQAAARSGDVNGASENFDKAKQLDPNIKLDSATEANRLAALAKADQGDTLLAQSDVLEALRAYQKALELDPRMPISIETWNSICWIGALEGHAAQVMSACEKAVALAPSMGEVRDSRGLARALTGNRQGAIEDFQAFIDHPPAVNQILVSERIRWVSALKAGRNPFTPEVLKSLQRE